MSKEYTQYDWAMDRQARTNWVEEEERLMEWIDRPREKRSRRMNRKNHRNYL